MAYYGAANAAVFVTAPAIIAVVTFAVYTIDNEMTASKAFTAILLFGMLRMPLIFYPMILIQFVAARESWRRIDKFANLDEIQEGYYKPNEGANEGGGGGGGPEVMMAINGSSFSWGAEELVVDTAATGEGKGKEKRKGKSKGKGKGKGKEAVETDEKAIELEAGTTLKKDDLEDSTRSVTAKVLNDVHVSIARGELVAVVGRVGSGKTALAAAFLGELKKWGGEVTLNGTVAYMAQTPWILNETLRQNVVFGSVYDEAKYKRAIRVSCLEHDLDTLPNGDQTEIGERGINLSGGQKARVSIARGVYSQADNFIFDDPLSALDAEVGHKIFEELIVKELAGKVRGAVTHDTLDASTWSHRPPTPPLTTYLFCRSFTTRDSTPTANPPRQTRLLVTNQLWCLAQCDRIVVLGDDQRIAQQGTFQELMSSGLNFSDVMKEFGVEEEEEGAFLGEDGVTEEGKDDAVSTEGAAVEGTLAKQTRARTRTRTGPEGEDALGKKAAVDAAKKEAGKLGKEEDREKGAVGRATYSAYITQAKSKVPLNSSEAF
jgi:ABC-type multidrug transport system fused ATPase/permease subunit